MTLTEEEAREKWCPVLAAYVPAASGNCLVSECMAWRWDMAWASSVEEGHGGDLVLRLKRLTGEPKRGYCGLAGKPET